MAFTSIDLVRTHLAGLPLGQIDIRDVRLILSGTAPYSLPHSGLVDGSVIVKARRSMTPVRETRTLADGWIILNHAQLVPGTVLVASDSSLGIVYTENVDFIVDAGNGRIKRLDSGAIAYAQIVSTWYAFYHVYVEGDDFTLNAALGTISRKSAGLIGDGQEVVVDYTVALGTVSDQVIEQAITESAETVLALVSDAYHEEPTPGIVIGATHLAVAQVARMRAGAVLADTATASSSSRTNAQAWLDVATRYEQTAGAFLSRFARPIASRSALRRG